jgi:hypothetical protein
MAENDDIRARSITLVDVSGRPRIIMEAGGADGHAHISIFSDTHGCFSISTQPNGAVVLRIDRHPMVGALTISEKGIVLRDPDGKLGVSIGDLHGEGVQQVTVYRNGQPVWETSRD